MLLFDRKFSQSTLTKPEINQNETPTLCSSLSLSVIPSASPNPLTNAASKRKIEELLYPDQTELKRRKSSSGKGKFICKVIELQIFNRFVRKMYSIIVKSFNYTLRINGLEECHMLSVCNRNARLGFVLVFSVFLLNV